MFSNDVVDTDRFLDMPVTSQALYFHLGMRADDDGFVSSPKKIIKIVNCTMDDFRILITKGYVIPFNSGVVVITDWKTNNFIRSDRHKPTQYQEEKALLTVENGVYSLAGGVGIPYDNQLVDQRYTQVRLGKDSIDKYSILKDYCPELEAPEAPEGQQNQSEEESKEEKSGILLPLVDKTNYDVPLSKISLWSEAYPAVDVRAELKKMIAWLDANPKKKKTPRGIARFITGWLEREQNRGGHFRQQSAPGERQRRQQETKEQREANEKAWHEHLKQREEARKNIVYDDDHPFG